MTTKRSIVTSLLLFGLAAVGDLSAHDVSKHKGNATEGEIVAVADDSFVMKTAKGNVTVTLNKDTKIEHADQVVDKTHLMKGEGVTVFGTKLPSGQLVAKEVVMGSAKTGGKPKTEHKH